MKWLNLRKNKCPKCNKDLINGLSIKPLTNDAIVHEFIHYAISCEKKTKDNELCVRSAQKMLLELNIIK